MEAEAYECSIKGDHPIFKCIDQIGIGRAATMATAMELLDDGYRVTLEGTVFKSLKELKAVREKEKP